MSDAHQKLARANVLLPEGHPRVREDGPSARSKGEDPCAGGVQRREGRLVHPDLHEEERVKGTDVWKDPFPVRAKEEDRSLQVGDSPQVSRLDHGDYLLHGMVQVLDRLYADRLHVEEKARGRSSV